MCIRDRVNPNHEEAWYNLGGSLGKQGNLDGAIEAESPVVGEACKAIIIIVYSWLKALIHCQALSYDTETLTSSSDNVL